MSHCLWPHELQHSSLSYPSLSPRICSNWCPLNQWCYPIISSFVTVFSFCLPSFPASRSFAISWLFASGGELQHQSFQQVWSPCCPRDSQEYSPTPQFKSIKSLVLSFLHSPTLTSLHDYWKNIALTIPTFVGKAMSLLFNTLSRLSQVSFQGASVF